jgi:hypothetical protein
MADVSRDEVKRTVGGVVWGGWLVDKEITRVTLGDGVQEWYGIVGWQVLSRLIIGTIRTCLMLMR